MEEIIQVDNNQHLPPLPASDPESIARNRYNGFYGVGSREYWQKAEVTLNRLQDTQTCSHYFTQAGIEVRCQKCHMGFRGSHMRAENGKLFLNEKETVF